MPAPSPAGVAALQEQRAQEEARRSTGPLDFGPLQRALPRPSIPFGQQRNNILGYLQNENIPLSSITPFATQYLGDLQGYSDALAAEQARRQQAKQDYLMSISQGLIEGAVGGTPDAVAYDLLTTQMEMAGVNPESPLMQQAYDSFRELYPTYGSASYTAQHGAPAPSGGNFSPLYTGEMLAQDSQGQQAISQQVSSLIQTYGAQGMAGPEMTSNIIGTIMTQAGFQPLDDSGLRWGMPSGEVDPMTGQPTMVPVPQADQMLTGINNAMGYWLPAYEAQQAQIMAAQGQAAQAQRGPITSPYQNPYEAANQSVMGALGPWSGVPMG